MLPARGPFADGSSSKLTRCPSLSCSNAPLVTELRWKNHSWPPSSRMKPNPRSLTNRLIVPFATSPYLRGLPWRQPYADMAIKVRSSQRDALSEQAAPDGDRLQLARRRLKRQRALGHSRGEAGVRRQDEARDAAASDNPRVIGSERRHLGGLEHRVGMFGEDDARVRRERAAEPESKSAGRVECGDRPRQIVVREAYLRGKGFHFCAHR